MQDDTSTPLRVLVVDDDKDTTESMAMLIRLWGHEVREAHEGPEALVVATAFRPNVVFLDICLPGMDGFEVARCLRRQSCLSRVVLVALTGYGDEDIFRWSAEAGCNFHLVKPASPDDLQALLVGINLDHSQAALAARHDLEPSRRRGPGA